MRLALAFILTVTACERENAPEPTTPANVPVVGNPPEPTAAPAAQWGGSWNSDFGVITFTGAPARSYKIGDRIEMIVPHCDPVVNLYDVMYGIRNDRVERLIPVTARGKSQ